MRHPGKTSLPPKAITAREMEVIPPGTCVNPYAAYDILRRIKTAADIVIPLHEPSFATGAPIGRI
ncbi:metallo-beta-lactamase family protein [Desulfovibrio sp. DV]|nr:metallo-beta-lactamase family protein [Desulfovibrio sp. DV]